MTHALRKYKIMKTIEEAIQRIDSTIDSMFLRPGMYAGSPASLEEQLLLLYKLKLDFSGREIKEVTDQYRKLMTEKKLFSNVVFSGQLNDVCFDDIVVFFKDLKTALKI